MYKCLDFGPYFIITCKLSSTYKISKIPSYSLFCFYLQSGQGGVSISYLKCLLYKPHFEKKKKIHLKVAEVYTLFTVKF